MRGGAIAVGKSVAVRFSFICLVLVGCGSKGTIATAGTPSERALCTNLATPPPPGQALIHAPSLSPESFTLIDTVLNDPNASPVMLTDGAALKTDYNTGNALLLPPNQMANDAAKLAADCQASV